MITDKISWSFEADGGLLGGLAGDTCAGELEPDDGGTLIADDDVAGEEAKEEDTEVEELLAAAVGVVIGVEVSEAEDVCGLALSEEAGDAVEGEEGLESDGTWPPNDRLLACLRVGFVESLANDAFSCCSS